MQKVKDGREDVRILIVGGSRSVSLELQRSIEDNFGSRPDSVRTYAEAREYLDNSFKNIFLTILDLDLLDSQDSDRSFVAKASFLPKRTTKTTRYRLEICKTPFVIS